MEQTIIRDMQHPIDLQFNFKGAIYMIISWGGVFSAMMIPFSAAIGYLPLILSSIASCFAIRHYWLTDRKPKDNVKQIKKKKIL